MGIIQYILLAFVQGLTEFIPVSSSGHLAFFQVVFGFKEPLLLFDIILHLATTLSVLIFLRREIAVICVEISQAVKECLKGEPLLRVITRYDYARLSLLILLAFVPAIVFGLLFHDVIEKMFASLRAVGISFIITGTVLFFTRFQGSAKDLKKITFFDAVFIGIAQAVAIMPGISRSGMTISMGIFRKADKELAAKFSFLLSIPTILAAAVYKLKDGIGGIDVSLPVIGISFVAAFLSGYAALVFLSRMVAKARFHHFSYYCWLMGIFSIIISMRQN